MEALRGMKYLTESYPKINIICQTTVLIFITQVMYRTCEMKEINEMRSSDACKGSDVNMLWNVYKDENKSQLRWYFNGTMICSNFPEDGFTVKPPYQGRIEMIGITEIRLKNVSTDDEGIYVINALRDWSTSDDKHKIYLRVLEPPTDKCNCKMLLPPNFSSELRASHCGRPNASPLWEIKQTSDVLVDEILCCLDGDAMKCVDDKKWFCANVSYHQQNDKRPSGDGITHHADSVKTPVFREDDGSINLVKREQIVPSSFEEIRIYFLVILLLVLSILLVVLVRCLVHNIQRIKKERKELLKSYGLRVKNQHY